jgi:hypothetical protein
MILQDLNEKIIFIAGKSIYVLKWILFQKNNFTRNLLQSTALIFAIPILSRTGSFSNPGGKG